jgi:transcriptional regulator with XRE-family HTH domain
MNETVKGSAKRFKRLRKQLGLSQSQMAVQLGVGANTVARWERGDLIPPRLAELAAECLILKRKKGARR